jgi:hypothetical protein
MHHLYLKIHNTTGLKYLGMTTQDPHTYSGSGKRWKSHLRVHGHDVFTVVLGSYGSIEELTARSIGLSEKFDIANSPDWANLKREDGHGGSGVFNLEANRKNSCLGGRARAAKNYPAWNKGISTPRSQESIEKQRATMTGKPRGPYKNRGTATSHSKQVILNGVAYPSIAQARRNTGISKKAIRKHLLVQLPSQEQILS